MNSKANDRQVGGEHYRKAGADEQHWDRVHRLSLDYFQAQITKYVERCWDKNGIEDLEKARHFLDKYIELSRAAGRKGARQEDEEVLREVIEDLRDKLDFVLSRYVITEDGKFTFLDGETWGCLRGHPLNPALDFTFEGAYGTGRVRWRCIKCKAHFFTEGAQLPHAAHICGAQVANINVTATAASSGAAMVDHDGSEPQPHGYVDQDGSDLAAGPHTMVLPAPPAA